MERPAPTIEQQEVLSRMNACAGAMIIGIDEVGYGACAGPLVVCGVLAARGWDHSLAQDSKRLTPKARENGFDLFTGEMPGILAVFLAMCDAPDIDCVGVVRANMGLTQLVAEALYDYVPSPVLLDGNMTIPTKIPRSMMFSMPKADRILPATGAASVVAKVWRDHHLDVLDDVYPGYGFKQNKGYLTADHQAGLSAQGAAACHRISYEPIGRHVLNSNLWQSRQQLRETHAWISWLVR